MEQADKSYGLNLHYGGYEIKGKYSLPGLPAMYREGQEDAETLKIRTGHDQVSGLAVMLLYYRCIPGSGILLPGQSVENEGMVPAALKRYTVHVWTSFTGNTI